MCRAFNVLNQGERKKFLSMSTKLSKSLEIPKKLATEVTKTPKKCGTGCRLAHLVNDSGTPNETHLEAPSELIFPDLRLGRANPKYSLLIKEPVVQLHIIHHLSGRRSHCRGGRLIGGLDFVVETALE